jgi:uncharacterized protein YpmB
MKKEKGKKKSRKGLIILLIILVVLVVVGIYIYTEFKPVTFTEQKGIDLTTKNFPSYLEDHQIVQNLPDDAEIELNVDEESFVVGKGSAEKGNADNADVSITISEDDINAIGEEGLCGAIKSGSINDVDVETELSESELAWKYKSMLKYKDCFE